MKSLANSSFLAPLINRIVDLCYVPLDIVMRIYERGKKRHLISSFKSCGQNPFIGPQCMIRCSHNLEMGNNVCINTFTHIFADGGVKIGDNTLISANCSIGSITHISNSANRLRTPLIYKPITIGKNVWIGMGAVILPGVSIGDHAIVGAGAVVTKNVPPQTVVVGNPAKFLKMVDLPDVSPVQLPDVEWSESPHPHPPLKNP